MGSSCGGGGASHGSASPSDQHCVFEKKKKVNEESEGPRAGVLLRLTSTVVCVCVWGGWGVGGVGGEGCSHGCATPCGQNWALGG
jgi:hypothetical protein